MGASIGLILGGAVAGGAEGAGRAAVNSLASTQEAQQKEDLVKMQMQLEEQKDLRVMEAGHGYRMEEQGAQFAHEDTTQANQQKFLGGEGDKNRTNAMALGQLQSTTEIKAAGIHAGASLAAARISAGASMANARLAAMGKSITTLGDGRIVAVGMDSSGQKQVVTPLMDPADPSKPLMGMKNLDQRTILLAQSFGNEGTRLMGMGQQDEAQKQFEQMRNILMGKDPGDTGTHKVASSQSVDHLLKNPNSADQFDAQFGKGQAAMVIQQAKAQGTTTPATTTAPAGLQAGSPSGYPAAAPAAPTPPTAPAGSTLAAEPGSLGSGTSTVGYKPAGLGLVNGNLY